MFFGSLILGPKHEMTFPKRLPWSIEEMVVVGPRSLWQSRRRGSWASRIFWRFFLGSQVIRHCGDTKIFLWRNLADAVGEVFCELCHRQAGCSCSTSFQLLTWEKLQPPKSNKQSFNRWNSRPQICQSNSPSFWQPVRNLMKFPPETLPTNCFFEVILMLWNLALLLWRQLQDTWNP